MFLLPITIVGHSGNDGLKLGRRELDAGACRCGKTLRPAAPSQDHARRQALAGRTGIATPPRSSTGASAALLGGSGEKDGRQGGTAGRLWTTLRPLWKPAPAPQTERQRRRASEPRPHHQDGGTPAPAGGCGDV